MPGEVERHASKPSEDGSANDNCRGIRTCL
jgi:hypothetical protein